MKTHCRPQVMNRRMQQNIMLWGCFVVFLFAVAIILNTGQAFAAGELVRAINNQQDFLKNSEKQKARSNWQNLIKEFEEAATVQPEMKHASKARFLAATMSFESGKRFKNKADLQKAADLAKKAVRNCSRCSHSAEAQLLYGQALSSLNNIEEAERQLMKVELNHPDANKEIQQARKLLASIRGSTPPVPERGTKNDQKENSQTPTKPKEAPQTKQGNSKKQSSSNNIKIPAAPKARNDGLTQVYFISLEDKGDHSLVTLYVDKVSSYVYNLIPPSGSGHFRAYADIKGAVIAPKTNLALKNQTDLVKLVKINQFKDDVVRLVVDMPEAYPYAPVFLDKPPRLIVQISKDSNKLPAPQAEAQPQPPDPVPTKANSEKVNYSTGKKGPGESLARQLGLKVRRIIIDPGHGGKDQGASGFDLKEKDIVLKLAKKLKSRLNKKLDVEIILTRSEDKFITLERRTKICQEQKGDLFISLHVNANTESKVEGFETYVLNFATDRSAMAVAARENAMSNKSIAEMESVLKVIAKNTKISESRAMAQAVHKSALASIRKKYKMRDLGIKEAPFFVLVGVNVPAVLVEIGFISNEKDAEKLKQDAYLNLVADGIADGLIGYIKGF